MSAVAQPTAAAARRVPRAWHLIERNFFVYRRTWTIIVSGFFEPLFYLVGIGFGLGQLVGDVTGPGGQPIPYAMFVAPALLATGAMNGAVNEATYNFFFKLNYNRTFQSVLATPLAVWDVAIGELGWALVRGGLYALGFMVVISVMGLVTSPLAILAFPAALLLGFAVGAAGMAATSFMRTTQDFDAINVVVLPMFLFSATFYPIETYPDAIRGIVALTPLYQGVALIRGLTVGVLGPEMLFNIVYLVLMGGIGLWITSRRLDRVLLK
ncbi:MAG: ABC transporter permease [Chloroflexota bacterium]